MVKNHSNTGKCILAALVGAAAGGALISLVTRAVPQVMPALMRKMMSKMEQAGCEPEEMCKGMMERMGKAPEHPTCHA